MSTSPTTTLSKPEGATKIPVGTLRYVCARNRQRAYDVVIKEFKNSGLSQADLARRLGKGTDVLSRLLSRPSNWEMDTFGELLFGISGAVPTFGIEFPLGEQESLQYFSTTATKSSAGVVEFISDPRFIMSNAA